MKKCYNQRILKLLDVKIKKLHKDAVVPTKAYQYDAGFDLTAVSKSYDEHGSICYGTGLAFSIPENFVGLIFPRSSICKKDLSLANSVGVIDSGYLGEVSFKFKPTKPEYYLTEDYVGTDDDGHWRVSLHAVENSDYKIGERIGQLIIIPIPQINLVECDDLGDSERGVDGFGSSGK